MVEKEPARVCRFFCAITVQMKTVFNTWDIGKCSYKNLGFYNPSTVSVEESVVPVVPEVESELSLAGVLNSPFAIASL